MAMAHHADIASNRSRSSNNRLEHDWGVEMDFSSQRMPSSKRADTDSTQYENREPNREGSGSPGNGLTTQLYQSAAMIYNKYVYVPYLFISRSCTRPDRRLTIAWIQILAFILHLYAMAVSKSNLLSLPPRTLLKLKTAKGIPSPKKSRWELELTIGAKVKGFFF